MLWLLSVVSGLIVSIILTPVAALFARKIGLVDAPDGHRKLHGRVVPLGGGLAIVATLLLMGTALVMFFPEMQQSFLKDPLSLIAILIAVSLICLVGFIDDWQGIRGRQKLAAQTATCLIVAVSGTTIQRFELFGYTWELGIFAIPVTCLWLLAIINAMNLIDGADGLATTVGIVVSITFAIMAHFLGHTLESLIASILAGALLGFLVYNRPPARIFLGDAGSMAIGLLLGVLAIRSCLKGHATVTLAAATTIWTVLFFDVLMAIARRKLTGRSLYTVDRGHIHHVLQYHGFSPAAIVIFVGIACTICAVGALFSVAMKNEAWAILAAGSVIAFIVGFRIFGFSECELFVRRLRSFLFSLTKTLGRKPGLVEQAQGKATCSRFRGNREWDILWESLTTYADRFRLCKVQLNVCSPAISEEYHAVWNSHRETVDFECWSMEVPLYAGDLRIGSLAMVGKTSRTESNFNWLSDLLEGLNAFEMQLLDILDGNKEENEPEPVSTFESEEMDTLEEPAEGRVMVLSADSPL